MDDSRRRPLNKSFYLLAPGVLGNLLGYLLYPPLDAGPLLALALCAFSLPVLLQLARTLRKQPRENAGPLRTVYACSGLALVLLAGLLLLNGRLDGSPPNAVRATVIQKTVTTPRTGTTYHLTVSSWRPGRSSEEFEVGTRIFNRTAVGQTITVELHKGFFGLPWSGGIRLE